MPDLTIELHEMCESLSRVKTYHISKYEQTLYHGAQMDDTCTCPAYTYSKSKTCKHLKQAYEQECGWHGAYDEPQETPGICPRCGGPTIVVRVAV